ncbi:TPA: hypothetical protein DIS56_03260 [Candidatus Saccharibacteria bacterium]|nr:MAG: hypothetical protein A3F05_01165 [Candidatus Saccharibacteria bacterium RIFCSPHIGHO2_12_FULL_47_17]HCM52120.1 hypothetical protein [Candidatus Saccharibacteria bacterium]
MTTVLNVKIDDKLKKDAQEAAKAIGLPISTVVAAGLREFVRTRSITISDEPRLRPEVEAELLAIEQDIKKRKDLSPSFSDFGEARRWLEHQQ